MVNLNGKLVTTTEANLSYTNRGLNFGDALFETIRVSAGKIFFWEDHYFRLMASMRIMRMEIPMNFTMEYLSEQILSVIDAPEKSSTHRIKMLVWRESTGKYAPDDNEIGYLISSVKMEESFFTIDNGHYEIELFKDHYVTSGLLSTLKTNNKAINVLGSIYAKENEFDNCLLLNEKKNVVEALNGNIFLVNGYKIKTPPIMDGCLNGILRKQIIKILGTQPDYILEEESVSPFELQKADEIFITNAITGIQPVSKYRKKHYNSNVAKELIGKLNAAARLG
jgi:branched-chain amino acid aminotransferase